MDASPMAKGYYKLPDNAKWVDTLKCIVSLAAPSARHKTEHSSLNKFCWKASLMKTFIFPIIRWQTRHITET
jgi:hypothetical protein